MRDRCCTYSLQGARSTAAMSDNVKDLLDSLDVKQGQKSKPKKSSTKRKETKKAGNDILGFLDELDKKGESKGSQKDAKTPPKVEATAATSEKEVPSEPEPAGEKGEAASADEAESSGIEIDPVASLSSWWSRNKGGLWSTALNASNQLQDAVTETVKQARQAEANMREENQAQFSLSGWQNRLTSVFNTIIPPIARHEQLRIHIFHDMVGYPTVDKLLYEVFDYVMDQVEGGGDLNLVVQKGKERHRVGSDHDVNRDLNAARCSLADAAKLARANVEGIPRPQKQETTETTEGSANEEGGDEPVHPNIRVSEIYVAIQPVITPAEASDQLTGSGGKLFFIVHLLDQEHNIEISTPSQGMPEEWAQWLDDASSFKDAAFDPREWVFGWVEDALNLAFGVTAQKYVTTRMGLTAEAAKAEAAKAEEESKAE